MVDVYTILSYESFLEGAEVRLIDDDGTLHRGDIDHSIVLSPLVDRHRVKDQTEPYFARISK